MNFLYKKGFTILELIIVVAIVAVLLVMVIPQFSRIKENQVLQSATSDVMSTLSKSRSETISSVNSSEYGVHFQSDKVIIFKGKTYSAGASDNEVITISTPASISNVTLGGVSSTSGDIYFSRLSGAPSAVGTVTVSTSSFSKTITISATGSVSVN